MTHEGRQDRQARLDIEAGLVPIDERRHRETVAKVVVVPTSAQS
jgi:hypothetical protein